jgi:hypothetical protein
MAFCCSRNNGQDRIPKNDQVIRREGSIFLPDTSLLCFPGEESIIPAKIQFHFLSSSHMQDSIKYLRGIIALKIQQDSC